MLKFSDYQNFIKNSSKAPLVLYAAGLLGKLILESLRQKNITVDYFCDRDEVKWNTEIKGVKVISPAQLKDLDKNSIDAIIKKSQEKMSDIKISDKEKYLLSHKIDTLREIN